MRICESAVFQKLFQIWIDFQSHLFIHAGSQIPILVFGGTVIILVPYGEVIYAKSPANTYEVDYASFSGTFDYGNSFLVQINSQNLFSVSCKEDFIRCSFHEQRFFRKE